jgi:hypothetical protein
VTEKEDESDQKGVTEEMMDNYRVEVVIIFIRGRPLVHVYLPSSCLTCYM